MTKWGVYPRNSGWCNIQKSTNVIHHINTIKENKNHMIILTDAEKVFGKIQYLLMTPTQKKIKRGECIQSKRAYMKNLQLTLFLKVKDKRFPLKEQGKDVHSHHFFQHCITLASEIKLKIDK